MECYQKEECRLCDSKNLASILELEPTPPGNHFVAEKDLGKIQEKYPLTLNFCQSCSHIQLGHVVSPNILYKQNYSYVSSTSPVFVKHLNEYAEKMVDIFNLTDGSLVVDVGSNDGTTLSCFKQLGCTVLGVDPAQNIVDIANDANIPTLCEFFCLDVAKKLSKRYGAADFITSHNVCAHIDEFKSVMEGVKYWLKETGIFVFEVGYFADVFKNKWFDTIYHEHVDFHTLSPLVLFFDSIDMEVFNVEKVSPQGGSLRVYVQHKSGLNTVDESVSSVCKDESNSGLTSISKLHDFSSEITKVRSDLRELLQTISKDSKTIIGFGAPTKATTLISYFNIEKYIDYIVEDNPLKQNLYTPGSHIPVYSAEKIYEDLPDYMLILAWNFAEDIMKKHRRFKEAGGKFILPMPVPVIC